jgi:hypothetical protein
LVDQGRAPAAGEPTAHIPIAVAALGGELEIESVEGQGTTVRLRMPLSPGS